MVETSIEIMIKNLSNTLKKEIKKADELWVAVALMSNSGLKIIQDNIKKDCKEHYILGVDLPTNPKCLRKLNSDHKKKGIEVLIYAAKAFFHLKVYILRQGEKLKVFIGSANCTQSGLSANIEMSVCIDNQNQCEEFLTWFDNLKKDCKSLSNEFMAEYVEQFKKTKGRNKENMAAARSAKDLLTDVNKLSMSERKSLVRELILFRKRPEYSGTVNHRRADIKKLQKTLDYPTVDKLDIEEFFHNWALGYLRYTAMDHLKKNKSKFKKLLRFLIDDSIDISERINRALHGDMKVNWAGYATIAKILTIHNPKEYIVRNGKIDALLKKYGMVFPDGISEGNNYKLSIDFFNEICKETGIDNYAVLDYKLYKLSEEK